MCLHFSERKSCDNNNRNAHPSPLFPKQESSRVLRASCIGERKRPLKPNNYYRAANTKTTRKCLHLTTHDGSHWQRLHGRCAAEDNVKKRFKQFRLKYRNDWCRLRTAKSSLSAAVANNCCSVCSGCSCCRFERRYSDASAIHQFILQACSKSS